MDRDTHSLSFRLILANGLLGASGPSVCYLPYSFNLSVLCGHRAVCMNHCSK